LKPSITNRDAHLLRQLHGALSCWFGGTPHTEPDEEEIGRALYVFFVAIVLAFLSLTARAQSLAVAAPPADAVAVTTLRHPDLGYTRPTQRVMLRNYAFDAFGPFPLVGAGAVAGIGQLGNAPPEWGQGAAGYGKRIGSDFGIAAIATTGRYGLAGMLKEDTLYYRCECSGVFPRLRHAVLSTLTARRGDDGHRVFSLPALAAPYVGSITAVYGWYPDRFGVKDAFRIGNYSMLAYVGENISLEFFYRGPHSLFTRLHLNNTHGSPLQGPNR